MGVCELQFSLDNVVNAVHAWHDRSQGNRKVAEWLTSIVHHDLASPLSAFNELRMMVKTPHDNSGLSHFYRERLVENMVARAYIHNLYSLGMNYATACHDLVSEVTKDANSPCSHLPEIAKGFMGSLCFLVSYLPLTPVVEGLTTLNEHQRELCLRADIHGNWLTYVANRFFSDDYKREVYLLKNDLHTFWINVRHILEKDKISIREKTLVEQIETKDDYVANVVEPLVANAREHAYRKENDGENRGRRHDFVKEISVSAFRQEILVDDEPGHADCGDFTVTVRDNGFGIKQEYLPHIFERGFSTKPKDRLQHGVGLWSAKQFVEKHGGRMTCESNAQGTSFEFTIPYVVRNRICLQRQVADALG